MQVFYTRKRVSNVITVSGEQRMERQAHILEEDKTIRIPKSSQIMKNWVKVSSRWIGIPSTLQESSQSSSQHEYLFLSLTNSKEDIAIHPFLPTKRHQEIVDAYGRINQMFFIKRDSLLSRRSFPCLCVTILGITVSSNFLIPNSLNWLSWEDFISWK